MKSRRTAIRHPRKTEPILWVVDSEQWPRVCLRAELIERGYNPYGFIAIADAFDAFESGKSPKPEAVILELRGQDLTAERIERVRNLKVPTILLGGSAELHDPLISNARWDFVLKRPISIGMISDLINRLVPIRSLTPTSI
jgi:hypothetical protein